MTDMPDSEAGAASTDDWKSAMRLSLIPNVGPQIQQKLVEHFGSASRVLQAPPSAIRAVPGVGPTLARSICRHADEINVEEELAFCAEHGIDVVGVQDEAYPRNLAEIPDPPPVLYVQGELHRPDTLAIAIVGTRHATHYGKRQATRIAGSLARAGLTIISGMARGIDAAAHLGALEAGGRTIAVLPGGLAQVYPTEHKELAYDISTSGALVSELPSRAPVSRGSFPRRNRIVTGMSLGVVIIEAAERSGALISARHAMDQGREVFAMPGPVDSRVSRGCHALIRDGARLVESADDVLEELGPLVEATTHVSGEEIHHPAELQLNEQERLVLHLVESLPTSVDDLVHRSGLPVPRILATLSALEVRRLIRRVSGNAVVRL